MKHITKHYKHMRMHYLKLASLFIILNIIFIPEFRTFSPDKDNFFHVTLNEKEIGYCGADTDVKELLRQARQQVARDSEEMVYADAKLQVDGKSTIFGTVDTDDELQNRMEAVIRSSERHTMEHAYTVKIKNYIVNLGSSDDVKKVLQAALDRYENNGQYTVELVMDPTREFNILTAVVRDNRDKQEEGPGPFPKAGFTGVVDPALQNIEKDDASKDFDDFDLGLVDLEYGDDVEIVDTYLMADRITPVEEATEKIVTVEEKNAIYEVQPGDTLSQISEDTNIGIDRIIALNDAIENELSTIRIGQEIIITQPEPPLSVERQEVEYYEEDYDEEVQYIDNDEWYTTDEVTLQEPSAGHRKVVSKISYRNDKEISREILKEEKVIPAIPKIVERGTKIPPSYIKPVSGGRLSSGFGRRRAPVRGASTFHKGVDWAVPKGTAVHASSGGIVTKAGWGSGYGYVIYIKHPDGKETRYAHLSKCLVSPGQSVKQGQKIALSGNTGRSSGPHLHFEIRIHGTAVNPLKYLD